MSVRRAFVDVVVTALGVTVEVGVMVAEGLVTVLGGRVVNEVLVVVVVESKRLSILLIHSGRTVLTDERRGHKRSSCGGSVLIYESVPMLTEHDYVTYGRRRLGANTKAEITLGVEWITIAVVAYNDDRPLSTCQLTLLEGASRHHVYIVRSQICIRTKPLISFRVYENVVSSVCLASWFWSVWRMIARSLAFEPSNSETNVKFELESEFWK